MHGTPGRARLRCAAPHQAVGADSTRRCRHRRQSSFPSLDMEASGGTPHAQSMQRPPSKGHRRSQSFTLEGGRSLPRLSRDRPVLDARVRRQPVLLPLLLRAPCPLTLQPLGLLWAAGMPRLLGVDPPGSSLSMLWLLLCMGTQPARAVVMLSIALGASSAAGDIVLR